MKARFVRMNIICIAQWQQLQQANLNTIICVFNGSCIYYFYYYFFFASLIYDLRCILQDRIILHFLFSIRTHTHTHTHIHKRCLTKLYIFYFHFFSLLHKIKERARARAFNHFIGSKCLRKEKEDEWLHCLM